MKFKKSLLIICLVICLFAVASVSASDADDTAISLEDKGEIELSHESDMESVDNNLKTSEEQEIVKQTDNEEIMGETDAGTFTALKNKIANAQSGSTVYLENNYSCEDSWDTVFGIKVEKSNLVIDGKGHTIDARQKTQIFEVRADNVIIKNITFINAKIISSGGAILMSGFGGAVSDCSFVNCNSRMGGAVAWMSCDDGTVSNCVFINNTAETGGALSFFISKNNAVSDCVFINNAAPTANNIYNSSAQVTLNRNWFGNTAENYDVSPDADTDNWLFLNVTVNPNPVLITGTADVVFKLYLYNSTSGNITDYTSLANVDLALNSNGKLDKDVAGLDEKVTFTPTSPGTGSITATIGNMAYTTTLTVTDGTTFSDLNNLINNSTDDTITLDKDYAYNPDFDFAFIEGIEIIRPVTINGNGRTIDGKGKSCIFWVRGDNVNINNVTFVNGRNDYGGAIYWSGDYGAVSGSSFIGNNASENGGAIIWVGSDGTVSGSIFTDNTAESGYGGAIYWMGSRSAVSGSSFIGNNAYNKGGAICWVAANGNISDSIFINNVGNESDAIWAAESVRVDYCWFGNTAENYNTSLSGVDTDNWLFLNATVNPDPILITKTVNITFKLYSYNSTSKDTTDYTSLVGVNLTLSPDAKLDKNVTGLDEIVTYTPTSLGTDSITATIENVACTTTFIVTDGTTFMDLNKLINGNANDTITLDKDYAFNQITDSALINGIEISRPVAIIGNNHTIDGKGQAGIFWVTGNNVSINNIIFVNGHDDFDAGAIYWEGANGTVSGSVFSGNTADHNGGAIVWKGADGTVSDSIFTGNNASQDGGAIYWWAVNGTVLRSTFINNYADNNGGAVYWTSKNGTISDSIFINNTARRGAVVYADEFLKADYCWFGNTAENYDASPNGVNTDNWLFLNATVTPNPILITETAEIIFKLYVYNSTSKDITDYTSLVEVNLTLSSNGRLDKDVAGLDEKVTFTPKSPGTGSITATTGNVSYTTTFTVTTDGTTFWDLNNLINNSTNDTIILDKDYAYNPASDSAFTEGIEINRSVTINGNGHTLDGKGQVCILWVKVDNVTINNITFVNGSADVGGAIFWGGANGAVSCSRFIGNNASDKGGAIYWEGANGTVSGSIFTGNTAEWAGGAIYWNGDDGTVSGSIFTGNTAEAASGAIHWFKANGVVSDSIFIGNTAGSEGGAILWTGYDGVVSGSIFIGNIAEVAGGAISWYEDYGNVSNSIFINNTVEDEDNAIDGSVYIMAYYCWFGGNATNYKEDLPITRDAHCDYILFLNATANPDAVQAFNTSEIVFKLYLYNKNSPENISEYDNTLLLPVNLTISAVNGFVDSPIANFGDSIRYTATGAGNGSVTAAIENVEYTIEFNIDKSNPDLSVKNQMITYGENATIALNYNGNATGKVNITLTGKKGTFTYLNLDLNARIVLSNDFPADEYNVTVVYSGDVNFLNATANAILTVNKADSTLTVPDVVFTYGDSGTSNVSFAGATGVVAVVNDLGAVVEVNGSVITVFNLNAGNYILTVTAVPDDNHTEVTKTANITVNKAKTQLAADAITTTYNVNKDLVITLKDSNGKALSGVKVTVDLNGAKAYTTDKNGQIKINVAKLVPKTYAAKITFNGNANYLESTMNVKVVVKKAKAKITAKKKTFKKSKKVKKYAITLKSGKNPVKKVKVTIKIGKKTFKAKTNAKGKATFKIKKLTKKGKYKAVIKFKGNKYYSKATKKVKITIK